MMNKRARLLGVAFLSVAVVASGCTTSVQSNAPWPTGSHLTDPCTTGAGILCANNILNNHISAPPKPTVTPHNKLAVIFNGNGAQPAAHNKLANVLVADGFHVIALRYMSAWGTAASCPDAAALTDPDCHRTFHGEVTFGAGVPDPAGQAFSMAGLVDVNLQNSTENRLLQLVKYLVANFASEGWEQYQQSTGGVCTSFNTTYNACNLNWSKVDLIGHSLGSGQALYLSTFHAFDRVVMISGPFDEYLTPTLTVAPWITELGFATPSAKMYGFTHLREPNFLNQSAAWAALGLSGAQTSIDGNTPPYSDSHQLTTDATPGCTISQSFHNSTAQDLCTPGVYPTFAGAWQYLAAG